MHFDFRSYFRVAYSSFLRSKSTPVRLSPKRFLFLIVFFPAFLLIEFFNTLCLLLDELVFSHYRRMALSKPVFIVGNPRSGTTLIHRIMAKDPQFFCFRTWEILLPAVIQKKTIAFIGRVDRLLGSFLKNGIQRLEHRLIGSFNQMHHTSLYNPEEDEMLLIHIFSSFIYLGWLFPFEELHWLMHFDRDARDRDRRRVMTFYKKCVKRQMYFTGGEGHFLSKNPAFSTKIDSLYEFFPGCRIIYMVRNPLDVIPSMQSLAQKIWQTTVDIVEGDRSLRDEACQVAKVFYEYPLTRLESAPQNSYVLIKYEDLVRQPSRAIRLVYETFGFELSEGFSRILQEEDMKARSYESSHTYSLGQFQLTREQIVSEFREVFERFGFDTREGWDKH